MLLELGSVGEHDHLDGRLAVGKLADELLVLRLDAPQSLPPVGLLGLDLVLGTPRPVFKVEYIESHFFT